MGYSQAQNKATQKYAREHLDRIYLSVQKGEKERIKKAAELRGESIAMYIKKAIEMRMNSGE